MFNFGKKPKPTVIIGDEGTQEKIDRESVVAIILSALISSILILHAVLAYMNL